MCPDFFIAETPLLSPTACIACGAPSDPDGFVDLEHDFPMYGKSYLCGTCGRQIGRRFGMVATEELDEAEDKIAALTAERDQAFAEAATNADQRVVSIGTLRELLHENDPAKAPPEVIERGVGAVKGKRSA